MGYRLVNEVLDYAPADLGSSERLLLVALAAYVADESTRECWPGQASILRRTGITAGGLKKVFQRLAEHGLDPRVTLRKDKNGKPVYAYEGARTRYRIPVFAPPGDTATPEGGREYPHSGNTADSQRGDASIPTSQEGGPQDPHSVPSGDTPVPQRGYARVQEGGRAYPPKEKKEKKDHPRPPLQTEPHQGTPSATAAGTETESTGDHDDPPSSAPAETQDTNPPLENNPVCPTPAADAAAIVDDLARRYPIPAANRPDLAEIVTDKLTAGWTRSGLMNKLTADHPAHVANYTRFLTARLRALGTPPPPPPAMPTWCGQCNEKTRIITERINETDDRPRRCRCHPDAAKAQSDVEHGTRNPTPSWFGDIRAAMRTR